jgi:RNA polymerase sigma-70 factor (ECF subfamily)
MMDRKAQDAALLARARALDLEALAEVYDTFSPKLYAYALRLLGDPCLAEDCVADTFSRLLQALHQGRGPENYLQAYLYRIAHNWVIDSYRRQPPPSLELDAARVETVTTTALGPEGAAVAQQTREQVRAACWRLTPDQRQVVLLKYIEGWENEAIAAALQKPVGAIKALQHRGVAALKRLLLSEDGLVGDGTTDANHG